MLVTEHDKENKIVFLPKIFRKGKKEADLSVVIQCNRNIFHLKNCDTDPNVCFCPGELKKLMIIDMLF